MQATREGGLEKLLNEWFEQNPNIQIVDISYLRVGSNSGLAVFVTYSEKKFL
jgi:hypothetical protein